MHAQTWQRERFRTAFRRLLAHPGLSQDQLAELSGRSKSQLNRWSRAESRPGYDSLHQLATSVRTRFPDAGPLVDELMEAAGYGSHDAPVTQASSPARASPEHLAPSSDPADRSPPPALEQIGDLGEGEPTLAQVLDHMKSMVLAVTSAHMDALRRLDDFREKTADENADLRREVARLSADVAHLLAQDEERRKGA